MKTEFKAKKEIIKEPNREITDLKNEEWGNQLPLIEKLQKEGAEKFFKGLGDLKKAFMSRLSKMVCIDEGTAMEKTAEGVFPLAGSGRLLAKNREEALEKAARVAVEIGLEEITSHEKVCGASKIAYEWDNPGKKPTDKEVNDYAKNWAEELTLKIKSIGKEAKVSHILAEKVLRPKEFHNAVCVYYDGTGKFNPGQLEKIPQGFVISRGGLEKALGKERVKNYCSQELNIACSIAFGGHGLGKKFCKETPFTIIAIGKNPEHLGDLKREARGLIEGSDFKEDLKRGRIKIDGFAAEGL